MRIIRVLFILSLHYLIDTKDRTFLPNNFRNFPYTNPSVRSVRVKIIQRIQNDYKGGDTTLCNVVCKDQKPCPKIDGRIISSVRTRSDPFPLDLSWKSTRFETPG